MQSKTVVYSRIIDMQLVTSSASMLCGARVLNSARSASRGARRSSSGARGPRRVGLLGAPLELGTDRPGVIRGPDRLRDYGLVEKLRATGTMEVVDYGNVSPSLPEERSPLASMRALPQVAAYCCALSAAAARLLDSCELGVALGGDHSLAIGTIDAHCGAERETAVLYVDAHADINTERCTPSRNINGMGLALLARDLAPYWPPLPHFAWLKPRLSLKNLAYIGLRSVDPYERLIMQKYNIPAFAMDDVQRYGIEAVVKKALNALDPEGTKSIHVSFDLDSLDANEAPSTTIPLRGGLLLREAIFIMEEVRKTGRLRFLDVVEFNPTVGTAADVERTEEAIFEVVRAAIGYERGGTTPPGVVDLPLPIHNEIAASNI